MAQKVEIPTTEKTTKTVSAEQQNTSETIPTQTSLSSSAATSTTSITAEQRYQMIAEAAYAIAEQRDFKDEDSLDDWLQAEAEVDSRIAAEQ